MMYLPVPRQAREKQLHLDCRYYTVCWKTSGDAQQKAKQVKALILTPTRELAQQVFDSLSLYAKEY